MKEVGKHILAFIAGFVITFVVAYGVIYLALSFSYTRNPKDLEFSSQSWKNPRPIHERFQMLDDLQHDYLGIGMEDNEVLSLLGVPDNLESDSIWCYKVGSEGLLSRNKKLKIVITQSIVRDFQIE